VDIRTEAKGQIITRAEKEKEKKLQRNKTGKAENHNERGSAGWHRGSSGKTTGNGV